MICVSVDRETWFELEFSVCGQTQNWELKMVEKDTFWFIFLADTKLEIQKSNLFRFDNLRFWFANRHEIENSKTVEKVAILDFIFGGQATGNSEYDWELISASAREILAVFGRYWEIFYI